jgi:DNA-binding MarR family transcriptional regulator
MQRTKLSPVTRSARPIAPSARTDNRAKLDDVVTAILTASRVLVGVSARSLADVEDTVTLTQFRSLVVLDGHGVINLNRLADLLAVNRSTAMRMIDRLLVAELVTRQENPANRREVLLDLTEEGRQLVRQVTNTRRTEIARIVKAMPRGERDELVNALRTFADAAGEPEAAATTARLGW